MSKELDATRELVKMLEEKEKSSKVQLSTLEPGAIFKIGDWDFIVLKHENGATKVISKGLLLEDVVFDRDTRDYNKSNLKKKIETEIEPIIVKEIGQDNIIEHKAELLTVDNQKEYEDVTCRVRPLTFDEAREFNDLVVNEELDDWWWTNTPWSIKGRGFEYSVTVVSPRGGINDDGHNFNCGVRPFCILKSNIFVSKGE